MRHPVSKRNVKVLYAARVHIAFPLSLLQAATYKPGIMENMDPEPVAAQMPETLFNWLQYAAEQRHVHAKIQRQLVRETNGRYDVPVYISDALDACDLAGVLQDMENSWNDQEPAPYHQVLLISAAN